MSTSTPSSGEVIDVDLSDDAVERTKTKKLFTSDHIDVIRMFLPEGKQIAEHTAKGEISVHCLEGLVEFTVSGKTVRLSKGRMLCLSNREPHSLHALEDSSVLLTLLRIPDRPVE